MVIGNGLLPYFYLVRKADLGYICNLLVYTYLMNDIQIMFFAQRLNMNKTSINGK